jgi:anti-sigma regulatory factor (Ser/Thr protein kinase)
VATPAFEASAFLAPVFQASACQVPAPQGSPHGAPWLRLLRRLEWRDTFQLPALGTSVAEARRRVRTRLREWEVPEEIRDNAEVIVSELVTNAVRHTGSRAVGCELLWSEGGLRLEVADQGDAPSVPLPRQADLDEECGRGLLLVGALSDAWGVAAPAPRGEDGSTGHADDARGAGRVVWAVLRAG